MSAFVSYSDVVAGLHERLLTIPGFPMYNDNGDVVNLLNYEPSEIQYTPTIYTLLDKFTRINSAAQITGMTYRILHRLCIAWQDNEESELTLMSFVHAVPFAIEGDRLLNGRIALGAGATVSEGSSGFTIFSDTKYRVLDFFSLVETKAPVRSGI